MKFKKGDKVQVYGHVTQDEGRPLYMRGAEAKVIMIIDGDEILVKFTRRDLDETEVHPMQCRKIRSNK